MERRKKDRSAAEAYRKRIRTVYLLFLVGFLLTSISKRFFAGAAAPEDKPYFDYYPYFVFEHYVRTILVALGAYYTIRRAIALRGEVSRFRVVSLVSFVASLMVFMVAIPSLWGFTGDHFMGFSYLFMPFPWLSSVLHVAHTGETYHSSFVAVFGPSGIQIAIATYLAFQAFVLLPTLFYGRRWFCGMLCIFAGAHAETCGDALPLFPHDRKRPRSKVVHPRLRAVLKLLLAFELAAAVLVHVGLLTWLLGGTFFFSVEGLLGFEVARFLILDTFLLNLLWWSVGGRFYCYYCAPGFLLGLLGRAAGQRIETHHAECTSCKLCNEACKMSIDVMAAAEAGEPTRSVYCVGCGQCVDACPQRSLRYSTGFTRWWRKLRDRRTD